MDTRTERTNLSGGTYRNLALTAVAVLLGANLLQQAGVPVVSSAGAQVRQPGAGSQNTITRSSEPTSGGGSETANERVSAAEQRKEIIAELSSIGRRMDRIEAVLKQPLNVKVLSMPAQSGDKNTAQSTSPSAPQGVTPAGPVGVSPSPAAPAVSARGSN